MRGRRPKPIEQREAEDNPGRRPLPAPIRTGGRLPDDPPEILGDAGAELWVELTTLLGNVLDAADRAALVAMCLQWDRAAVAAEVLEEQGHYIRGSMGQMVAHPALAIEARAHGIFLKFAAEYAATPSARARVAAAKQQRDAQSQLQGFLGGHAVELDEVHELDEAIEDGEFVNLDEEPDAG